MDIVHFYISLSHHQANHFEKAAQSIHVGYRDVNSGDNRLGTGLAPSPLRVNCSSVKYQTFDLFLMSMAVKTGKFVGHMFSGLIQ